MATVQSFTAERMLQIESGTVTQARLQGDALILTTRGGTDIPVGSVRGPEGDAGPVADLNVVGRTQAVFIAKGGTIPTGTPPKTLIIELEA